MKIYINNLNIELLSNIMIAINEQYIDSETYIQVYSKDGIYQINDNKINKLNAVDTDIEIHNNYSENYTLIVDPSYFTNSIVNKIPIEHTATKIKRCFFQINKNSDIKLVVEGNVIEETVFNKTHDKNYGISPIDLYFEVDNNIDINDALIKNEINVFLSLLN